jgi:hypothetical protein
MHAARAPRAVDRSRGRRLRTDERWPARRATASWTRATQPSGLLSRGWRQGLWLRLSSRSSEAELTDNRVIHTVAPVVTPLALAVFHVRAPAPGARTLHRQAARPGATAGSAHSIARYAAFSRFAPGGRAPHMDHRLSEAPPRLWLAARSGWRRAAGPRPRRACSRAALAPRHRRAGGVARAALVAAPRLRRLRIGHHAACGSARAGHASRRPRW